jgi:TetR/AcrR family transcriptional regulator
MARAKTDDPKARAKILKAAETLFASRGYAGTAIRDIAAAARVNGAMVHYYFGNKEGLYHTILENAASTIRALLLDPASGTGSTRARLERFADAYAGYILSQPNLAKILYREMLAGGKHLREVASQYAVANYTLLRSAMAEGVKRGELRPIDLDLAPISLMGMIVIFQFLRPIISVALGKEAYDERFVRRLSSHTIDLFFNGAASTGHSQTRKASESPQQKPTRTGRQNR